jgi:predicted phosphohydrolase
MERFGWPAHPAPLAEAWDRLVAPDDLVVVAGDISWAMKGGEVLPDLAWLEARPGRKLLLRGNHDYWWPDSLTKLRNLLRPFPSIVEVLHNGNAVRIPPFVFAGVRGWSVPETPDVKLASGELALEEYRPDLVLRDAGRLRASTEAAGKLLEPGDRKILVMHFPPLYVNLAPTAFSPIVEAFAPEIALYGHLHGPGIPTGFVGLHREVRYRLVSCDAAGFRPVEIASA